MNFEHGVVRRLVGATLVATGLCAALCGANAAKSGAPQNGILPYLENSHFKAKPGELVVVPLTIAVGRSFDGRVSITQFDDPTPPPGGTPPPGDPPPAPGDPNPVAKVHWVSGAYLSCYLPPDDPSGAAAAASDAEYKPRAGTVPRIVSYTHLPGEVRDHNMTMWINKRARAGIYRSTIVVIAAGKRYKLPFEIEVL